MHELGVVFHIADSVVNIAQENGAARVTRVTLEVGEVSTILPNYLLDVWKWNCRRTPMLEDCALEIVRLPAVTYCDACGRTYGTVAHGKICPHCGSDKTWLQTGNEVNIRDIAVL